MMFMNDRPSDSANSVERVAFIGTSEQLLHDLEKRNRVILLLQNTGSTFEEPDGTLVPLWMVVLGGPSIDRGTDPEF